jgi:hypothetical protein
MAEPPVIRKTLADQGTRYQFYNELLEMWSDGLEAVNNAYAQFANEKDALRKKALTAAISLLTAERDRVADYDTKRFELAREIDRIPRTNWRIDEKEAEAKKAKESAKDDTNSGAETNTRKSSGESSYGIESGT